MSKRTITILIIVAVVVVITAAAIGIHHAMYPTMPMK